MGSGIDIAVQPVFPDLSSPFPGLFHPKGRGIGTDRDAELRKACREFESLFVYYLLKVMREGGYQSSPWGQGLEGQYYQSLFDMEVARKISLTRGIGLAEMIYRSLKDKGKVSLRGRSHGTASVK